jgi:hypothetical protein
LADPTGRGEAAFASITDADIEAWGNNLDTAGRSESMFEMPGQNPTTGGGLQNIDERIDPNGPINYHINHFMSDVGEVRIADPSAVQPGAARGPGGSIIPAGEGVVAQPVPQTNVTNAAGAPVANEGGKPLGGSNVEVRYHSENPRAPGGPQGPAPDPAYGPSYSAFNPSVQVNTPAQSTPATPPQFQYGWAGDRNLNVTGDTARYMLPDGRWVQLRPGVTPEMEMQQAHYHVGGTAGPPAGPGPGGPAGPTGGPPPPPPAPPAPPAGPVPAPYPNAGPAPAGGGAAGQPSPIGYALPTAPMSTGGNAPVNYSVQPGGHVVQEVGPNAASPTWKNVVSNPGIGQKVPGMGQTGGQGQTPSSGQSGAGGSTSSGPSALDWALNPVGTAAVQAGSAVANAVTKDASAFAAGIEDAQKSGGVEKVNPKYTDPPGTPAQLKAIQAEIENLLAARAQAEQAEAKMTAAESHHQANQGPIQQAVQGTQGGITATQAHQQAVARTQQSNQEQQQRQGETKSKVESYADRAAGIAALETPLAAFQGFTHFASMLPGDIGAAMHKMSQDADHMQKAFAQMGAAMVQQNSAQPARQQELQGHATQIQATGTKAKTSEEDLKKANKGAESLQKHNLKKVQEATGAKTQATTQKTQLSDASDKKKQQHDTLAQELQSWATAHKAARDAAIDETKKKGEAEGKVVKEVKEK